MKMDKNKIKKIIILCILGLGDTIHFTPCLSIIRKTFPNAKCTVLTVDNPSKEILDDNPNVDEVINGDFLRNSKLSSINLLLKLRKRKFDLSITSFSSYRRVYNIGSWLIGAKERISHNFNQGYYSQFTFLNTKTIPVEYESHNVENNLNLLKCCDIDTSSYNAELNIYLKGKNEDFATKYLDANGISKNDFIIGIHPGTNVRAEGKRWSEEKFANLSDILSQRFGFKIIFFFGPADQKIKEKIEKLTTSKHYILSDTSIKNVAAIIKKCKIMVGADSGLLHIASTFKIPVLVMYGPTDPTLVHPWKVNYKVIREDLPCSPCYKYTDIRSENQQLIECKIDDKFLCMKSITVQQVLNGINELARNEYPENFKKSL